MAEVTNSKTRKALTHREQLFVAEYLKDLNARRAAIAAGYKVRTGTSAVPYTVLGRPRVAEAITVAQAKRLHEIGLDANKVLTAAMRIAFADPRRIFDEDGHLLPPKEWPDDIAMAVSSVKLHREITRVQGESVTVDEKALTVSFWNKPQTIELLMRHLRLLSNTLEIEGMDELLARLDAGRERIRKELPPAPIP